MASNRRKKHIAALLGVALNYFSHVEGTEQSFSTPFASNLHTDGNIFGIVAKSNTIAVTRFDINIDSGTDTIRVDSRPGVSGRMVDLNDDGWTLVNSFPGVVGQGKNNITPLPAFDVPVVIPAGSQQAFYITTTPGESAVHIWYQFGQTEVGVYASNEDVEILEGHATGTSNGYIGWSTPRRWSGTVHYSILAEPSSSPSSWPSYQPSAQPSTRPSSQPSSEPSYQPSARPSSQPSSLPSAIPSLNPSAVSSDSPSSAPSEFPSIRPSAVLTLTPSGHPSLDPSQGPSSIPSMMPSGAPSRNGSVSPSSQPSEQPTDSTSSQPSENPTLILSGVPSMKPSKSSSTIPTEPSSGLPSNFPSGAPSLAPSISSSKPSEKPGSQQFSKPSKYPSVSPTVKPSVRPSVWPSVASSSKPSAASENPSWALSREPSPQPSSQPSSLPVSSTSFTSTDAPNPTVSSTTSISSPSSSTLFPPNNQVSSTQFLPQQTPLELPTWSPVRKDFILITETPVGPPKDNSQSPSLNPSTTPVTSIVSGISTPSPTTQTFTPTNINDTSHSPTRDWNLRFLPLDPTQRSSSVKRGNYLGHLCIVSTLLAVAASLA